MLDIPQTQTRSLYGIQGLRTIRRELKAREERQRAEHDRLERQHAENEARLVEEQQRSTARDFSPFSDAPSPSQSDLDTFSNEDPFFGVDWSEAQSPATSPGRLLRSTSDAVSATPAFSDAQSAKGHDAARSKPQPAASPAPVSLREDGDSSVTTTADAPAKSLLTTPEVPQLVKSGEINPKSVASKAHLEVTNTSNYNSSETSTESKFSDITTLYSQQAQSDTITTSPSEKTIRLTGQLVKGSGFDIYGMTADATVRDKSGVDVASSYGLNSFMFPIERPHCQYIPRSRSMESPQSMEDMELPVATWPGPAVLREAEDQQMNLHFASNDWNAVTDFAQYGMQSSMPMASDGESGWNPSRIFESV